MIAVRFFTSRGHTRVGAVLAGVARPAGSGRIDWQLFGRAGRHGAQGSAQAFASFEEELVERYLPAWAKPLRWLPHLPGTSGRHLALLLWLAQRHAHGISAGQRKRLAQVQEQLREHLGFTRE